MILAAQLIKRLDTGGEREDGEERGREGAREGREGWRRWWRGGGVLKLQKDTYTGEITGEFSRGK